MKRYALLGLLLLVAGCASNKVTVKAGKCFKETAQVGAIKCFSCRKGGSFCYNEKGTLEGKDLNLEVEVDK